MPPSTGTAGGQRPAEPILHADMDAFYASVEQRDDPTLQGRPVAVGGPGGRGVVAAASYEARRFGLHSAMPMVRARRLCPDLVVVPPRFDVYEAVSAEVMDILRGYTPLVEPLSLDEAFLDVGGARRLFGPPVAVAEQIRADIRAATDLPCSVGVAATKFAAKLLSGKAKPDGLAHLAVEQTVDYLRPLPVGDLWGAGPKTVRRLEEFGLTTIGELADTDRRTLERILGTAMGRQLHRLARGVDDREVTPHEPAKSLSAETTFEEDVDDPARLRRTVLALAERVAARLRAEGLAGRTVTLKVRFASFRTITRASSLELPTDRTHDVSELARRLLDGLGLERARVRLVGVGVSKLADAEAARQLTLEVDQRWEEIDQVADVVRERFEDVSVSYAALLDEDADPRTPGAS